MIDQQTYQCLLSPDSGLAPFWYAAICTVIILLIAVAVACVHAWRKLSHLTDSDAMHGIFQDRHDHTRTKL